jgi:hypothetical protein
MPQEELEIEITPEGKVTMRTHGIKGPACMDYADLLARIVGGEEHRQKTPEFYEQPLETTARRQIDVKQHRR